jgi:hypothetical protein
MLEALRRTILEIVLDAEQVLSYRVPAFRVGGKTVAGFATFQSHLSYLAFSASDGASSTSSTSSSCSNGRRKRLQIEPLLHREETSC